MVIRYSCCAAFWSDLSFSATCLSDRVDETVDSTKCSQPSSRTSLYRLPRKAIVTALGGTGSPQTNSCSTGGSIRSHVSPSHAGIFLGFSDLSNLYQSSEIYPRIPPGHSFSTNLYLPRSSDMATPGRLIWSRMASDPPRSSQVRGKSLSQTLRVIECGVNPKRYGLARDDGVRDVIGLVPKKASVRIVQSCVSGCVADSAGDNFSSASFMLAQGDIRTSAPGACGRCGTLSRLSVRYR